MPSNDAPYLRPKERRARAVTAGTDVLRPDVDIEEVKRLLITPYPRPEVADRGFMLALKAITALERQVEELKAAMAR